MAHRPAQCRRHCSTRAGRIVRLAGRLGRRRRLHFPGLRLRLHRHRARGPAGDDGRRLQRHHRFLDADPGAGGDHAPNRGRAQPGDAGAAPDFVGARPGARGGEVARRLCVLSAADRDDPRLCRPAGGLPARQDHNLGRRLFHSRRRSRLRAHRCDVHRPGGRRRGRHRDRRPGVERDEEPDHRVHPLPLRAARNLVHGVPAGALHKATVEPVLRLCRGLFPVPVLQPRSGGSPRHHLLREPGDRRPFPHGPGARIAAMAMNRWARRARAGSLSLVMTVVVLAVLVAVNVLASKSNSALDLTHGKLNTLAPQSVLAAQRLTSDLQVIGLFRTEAGNGELEVEALISLYQAQSSHVKYRRENVDTDNADVKKYALKEPNTVVLDYKGKTALLTPSLQGEVDFTAALLRLESDRVTFVCWPIVDGEPAFNDANQFPGFSRVANILAKNNFATRDLLISQTTSIPSDCDELAIIDPATALPAPSVKAVGDYLAAGGKLLIAAEPWAKDAASTESLNAALKAFGLGFSGALVVETDPSRRSSADATIPAVTAYGRDRKKRR